MEDLILQRPAGFQIEHFFFLLVHFIDFDILMDKGFVGNEVSLY